MRILRWMGIAGACLALACSASMSLGTRTAEAPPPAEPPPPEEPPEPAKAEIVEDQVVIKEKIHFDFDAATIKPESHQILDEVAKLLTSHPEIQNIRVEGHTDTQGTARRNQELSRERAAAVAEYLRKAGIPQELLSEGHGSDMPLCQEDTDDCHARNRRVEFHIVP